MRVATVFSGIGSPEQAIIKRYGKDNLNLVFACDNGERELSLSKEEIDKRLLGLTEQEKQKKIKELYQEECGTNFIKKTYKENYEINEEKFYEDIRFIDGNLYKDKVDLFVGGSPCQSFSILGKRGGLDDARGTLFYEYARLINEIQPKVFIYENVVGMINHDKGKTWETIKDIFSSLGYHIHYKILDSENFDIPQRRRRIFVVGFIKQNTFLFPRGDKTNKTMFEFLEPKVDQIYYLGEKGFEFVTNPKYKNRAQVNKDIIRTQKANQQFNWNGDFVFEKLDPKKHTKEILERAYIGEYNGDKGVIRKLTPRECARLMGFPDSYTFPVIDMRAYRQIGNSIVVNVLEEILKQIDLTGNVYE